MLDAKNNTAVSIRWSPAVIDNYQTGLLDIRAKGKRILSIPSQIGCRIGCHFCVSRLTPLVRNLTANEMIQMVRSALDQAPAGETEIELSFTGEGESLLNWRAAAEVCAALPAISPNFTSVRYCTSGLGADKLLPKIHAGSFPMRLQISLHAARQSIRDRLIHSNRTLPLNLLEASVRANALRFSAIDLNVVLQEGHNDGRDDLVALANWGEPDWNIVLNPHLGATHSTESPKTDEFERELLAAGRKVKRYRAVAAQICQSGITPKMRAQKVFKIKSQTSSCPTPTSFP